MGRILGKADNENRASNSFCSPRQWPLFLGGSWAHLPFHRLGWAGTSLHHTALPQLYLPGSEIIPFHSR